MIGSNLTEVFSDSPAKQFTPSENSDRWFWPKVSVSIVFREDALFTEEFQCHKIKRPVADSEETAVF